MNSPLLIPQSGVVDRTEMVFHAAMLAVAAPVLALSFLLQVQGTQDVVVPLWGVTLPPTCGMQTMWNLDCPGCGLTRSFIALAHGDLAASLAFNPGGILVFGVVVFQVVYRPWQLWRLWRGRAPYNLLQPGLWLWATIGVVLGVQWMVKVSQAWW